MATHAQLEQAWADLQSHLRTVFPDHVYQAWLTTLQPLALERSVLYLTAPGSNRDWIKRRFGLTLNAAAAALAPSVERIELVDPAPVDASGKELGKRSRLSFTPGLTHTFAEFVIGEGNRFAHAAALAAAEMPGQAYNPLFIYGPPGVGKTHLLQAIGSYIRAHEPTRAVRYATVEVFTNEFLTALHHKKLDAFKRGFREMDLLLLDDTQSLEGKAKTTEEFFYTLDAISSTGAQIVLAGDRHPSKIPQLEARLRARLQSGLIADLHPPDHQTRLAILQKEARALSEVEYDPGVLEHLAEKVLSNVAILKGAFIRLMAFSSLTEKPVTIELADTVLAALYDAPDASGSHQPSQRTARSLSRIHEITAATFAIPIEDLSSSKRAREVVYARQIAMYLARELTSLSLPEIARGFGGRDHTTVLYAHRKIQAQLSTDPEMFSTVDSIMRSLDDTP